MNFIQKCKRSDGFTLVELIVVIAILAILAGVAVPAYTGYIKKAEEAADNQLLAAVNTAFAAACLENGIATKDVVSASVATGGTTGAMTVTGISAINPGDKDDVNAAFAKYYTGNETATFKQFTGFQFVDGSFVGVTGTTYSLSYGGGQITYTQAQVDSFQGSNFADVGVENLLNKVNDVTSYATALGSGTLNNILSSPEFLQASADSLGVSLSDLGTTVSTLAQQMVAEGKASTVEEAIATINTNGAVLYAAQAAVNEGTSADVLSIVDKLGTGSLSTLITNKESATGLSQAALAYGMYTAYLNSDQAPAGADPNMQPVDILLSLQQQQDAGFAAYVQSAEGQADLQGYLASMEMITSSTSSSGAVSQLVTNGFNDADLVAALQGALG